MITKIRKRDGREAAFNIEKIAQAIFKAASATGGKDYDISLKLAEKVEAYIEKKLDKRAPLVEEIQDAVDEYLNTTTQPISSIFDYHYATLPEYLVEQRAIALEEANHA